MMKLGVFDSGVGGLSVLTTVKQHLPQLTYLYAADQYYLPYGEKTAAWICARSESIARFLIAQGAQAILIACNTATAAAADHLRMRFAPIPIIGMEPAVKPAIVATRNKKIGVCATRTTLESMRFAALLERFADDITVISRPCPTWVDLVESGQLSGAHAHAIVRAELKPLLAQGVDTLVLGCTHFPFLKPLITDIVGSDIILIDTAEAVARQVAKQLGLSSSQLNPMQEACSMQTPLMLYSSGDLLPLTQQLTTLWQGSTQIHHLPITLP